jgi:hypothetical protein
MEVNEVSGEIVDAAIRVHSALGRVNSCEFYECGTMSCVHRARFHGIAGKDSPQRARRSAEGDYGGQRGQRPGRRFGNEGTFRSRTRVVVEYPLSGLMVQVLNHSTEHRTQISAIITQLGFKPPDISGWIYMTEIGKFRELRL